MKHFVYSLITLLQVGFLCNAAQVGFNKVGYVVNVPNNSFFYYSVALQPDGKIVAVGTTDDDGNGDRNGLIARFNTDGSLDQTFNAPNGFINTEGGTNSNSYYSVAVQPDGKIVAVGRTDQNNGERDGLIAQFNTDGTLDQTFNPQNGFINTEGGTNSFAYNSVALQADGKIVAVGGTDDGNGLIARFKTNGTLDTETFNGTGFITNVPDNSSAYHSVALQPDGKIVAVGETDDGDGLIARFNANGELDQTFNPQDGFITNVPNNSFAYYSVAVQPDGKIVAVGVTDGNDNNGLIARFNTDGSLDQTFNAPHGFINTEGVTDSFAYNSVALQPDGKIVAVGWTDGNDSNGLIARFNTDGSLDQTFNAPHGFITNVPNNSFAYNSVALQPDGKIVAVGETDGNDNNGLIARFLSNGVLDAESNWNLQNFRESNNINKISIGLLG